MKAPILFIALAACPLLGCTERTESSASGVARNPAEQSAILDARAPEQSNEQSPTANSPSSSISAASSSVSAPGRATSAYLAGEINFISDGALSADRAGIVLQSDKEFEKTVRQFSQGAAASPEAQDLIAHYRAAIVRDLGEEGVLRDFSCGLSLCVGSIRTKSPEDYAAWSEKFANSTGAPSYSFGEITQKLSEGEYESRFIFSTDPGANSVSHSAKRR